MSAELELAQQPGRTLDLRNPATDSWTDVVGEAAKLAGYLCRTEFVPKELRGSPEKTTAAMLTGRELGLPPMQALSSVYVVHGSPGLYAEAMRGLILQAGHELAFPEMTSARCIIKGRRRDSDEWTTVSYTMGDAERAGDVRTNSNYRTRPAEMLLARATTRLARMIFADVIHGLRSVEELQDLAGDEVTDDAPRTSVSARVSRTNRAASRGTGPQGSAAAGAGEGPAAAPEGGPPARRRVELPSRRRAEPQPEGQEAEEAPQETPQEPTTAEQVPAGQEDQADAPEPQDDAQQARERLKAKANGPDRLTGAQRSSMMAGFTRLGVKDRDVRLGYLSELVGRELASGSDLTKAEASHVLDVLTKARDEGAFQAAVAAYADERAGGESDAEE